MSNGAPPDRTPAPPPSDGEARPSETRLETVDEVRQALAAAVPTPTVKQAAPLPPARPYQPRRRPPMALLHVLDDGSAEGEVLRLRTARLVIGRAEGDLLIPHDDMMSSRHAEVGRERDNNRWVWYLADLDSTNGVYVRVASTVLQAGSELLLGSRRYRFELPSSITAETRPAATQGWQAPSPADLFPSLVELKPSGEGARYCLGHEETWVGRDRGSCGVAVDDPLLDARHARFRRDRRGRWLVDGTGTVNGIWLRVRRIPVESSCHFQLGEQRFLLKVL